VIQSAGWRILNQERSRQSNKGEDMMAIAKKAVKTTKKPAAKKTTSKCATRGKCATKKTTAKKPAAKKPAAKKKK